MVCNQCHKDKKDDEYYEYNKSKCADCLKKNAVGWKFDHKRERVFSRDGGCVSCGITRDEHKRKYGRDITIHHKDGNGTGVPMDKRNNKMSNMETMCLKCHGSLEINRRELYLDLRKPVLQIKNGEVISIYAGLQEAAYVAGVDVGNISRVLTGNYKTTGGYKWQYA